ncbi:uncharacterized protein METZ01_LOCUS287883, partial [marine metagenome]
VRLLDIPDTDVAEGDGVTVASKA